MSKSFLQQVASHYYSQSDDTPLQDRCFVLPNRRSLIFFQRALGDCVREGGSPMASPQLYTINDFFYKVSHKRPTPKVRLLLELYYCYDALRVQRGLSSEPLDDFVFWGDVILSDFNEVDKYLVDPASLFHNIEELKGMQDDFSDLSPEQVAAIEQFVGHFRQSDGHLKVSLNAEEGSTSVKASFLQIWQLLLPLYESFNSALESKDLSYEGMAYRHMASRLQGGESIVDVLGVAFAPQTQFVFVGLNALNECEKLLMRRLRDAHLAQWCWDYVSDEIRHPQNLSSFFMQHNVEEFPQAFDLEALDIDSRQISVLSVPSSVGQAKQLPQILSRVSGGALSQLGLETAVVLPDEALLVPVLNSIPPEISHINVTMGYPMSGSALYTLMDDVASLQLHLRQKGGEWMYYHKPVWAILGNSIIKSLLDEQTQQRVSSLRAEGKYYISQDSFEGSELLSSIFRPIVVDVKSTSVEAIDSLSQYLLDLLSLIGSRLASGSIMTLEMDFARSYYQAVVSLREEHLPVLAQTYFRLLRSMVGLDAVHFKGEPLGGLQVMGPLETRALDFDNLIILSCNEGVFPRHRVSASFIPHELRKAFALPTYEYQDAVWAYYFYRMIQRARKVWLVYDSRLEGVRSGEESRYIKQLELHFEVPVQRYVAKSELVKTVPVTAIHKSEDDVAVILSKRLSASTLKNYLNCQLKFYYSQVKGLKTPDEVAESLDAGMVGNVFHKTMQEIYSRPDHRVSADYLKGIYTNDMPRVHERVRSHILEQLKTDEIVGRNLVYEDIICSYVEKSLQRDVEMMKEAKVSYIEILGLEQYVEFTIEGFGFKGYIDRLDSLKSRQVRVVDYKTGRVQKEDVEIDSSKAVEIADKIFSPQTETKKRPGIALQMYLYDYAVMQKYPHQEIVNSIYNVVELHKGPVRNVPRCGDFDREVAMRLKVLLGEMVDTSVPFSATEDEETCKFCDFKVICGR